MLYILSLSFNYQRSVARIGLELYKLSILNCTNTRNVRTRIPAYPHVGRDLWCEGSWEGDRALTGGAEQGRQRVSSNG